jgi:hypothetical protein
MYGGENWNHDKFEIITGKDDKTTSYTQKKNVKKYRGDGYQDYGYQGEKKPDHFLENNKKFNKKINVILLIKYYRILTLITLNFQEESLKTIKTFTKMTIIQTCQIKINQMIKKSQKILGKRKLTLTIQIGFLLTTNLIKSLI